MITLPSGRRIGPGEKPFIIAEVGSNWETLDHCLHAISMAKAAGADAVKFQAYSDEALFGRDDYNELYDEDRPRTYELFAPWRPDWLPKLKAKSDACGIEFMCSAFSPELVDAVNPYVNVHKVASAELSHVRILERVRDSGKPVILSTGASGPNDIAQALKFLEGVPVVLLYCVSAYPARDIDFRMLDELKRFGKPVGYSDHSTDVRVIPRAAVERGACVLEKHFNPEGLTDTPDAPHSLSTDEFKRMVLSIRGDLPFAWGSGEERDMITKHNRRLIATQAIKAGETLGENVNFGIYRSLKDDTRGLSPFRIADVHGRIATRRIEAGEAMGPGDFS